jgi:hypothetical protein
MKKEFFGSLIVTVFLGIIFFVLTIISTGKNSNTGYGESTITVIQGRNSSTTLSQITSLKAPAVTLRVVGTSTQTGNLQNWESPTSTVAYITAWGNLYTSGTIYSGGTALVAGANTALSNLVSVAINTSLISDTNNTDDIGSSAISFRDIFASGTIYTGTSILPRANNTVALGAFGQAFTNIFASGTLRSSDFVLSGTGTSTSNGGLSLTHLLSTGGVTITGSNTSTFTNGIQLSGGCFRMADGTCAGGGGGEASPLRLLASTSTIHNLTTSTITNVPYAEEYKISIVMPQIFTGSHMAYLIFNNDNSTNYAITGSLNSAVASAANSQVACRLTVTTSDQTPLMFEVKVSNSSTVQKMLVSQGLRSDGGGAGNTINFHDTRCLWANTTDLINRIDLFVDGGKMATGTSILIYGND